MNGEAIGSLITKSLMIITAATITISSAEVRNIALIWGCFKAGTVTETIKNRDLPSS